jgi:hypothetical protein
MKKLTMILLLSTLLIAVSCSSTTARFDYERGVDFSKFKTFGFFPIPPDFKGSELVLKRIGNAIAKDLTAKGLTETQDNPDLLIAAHTDVKDKIQVSSYGYRYAPYYYYGYWGTSSTTVHQYEEGTLIIDIVDNAEDEMIWRGVASRALPSNPTPATIDKIIDEVVSKTMSNYPPPR